MDWLLPLDRHIYFHKMIGWLICLFSVVHTVAHVINYGEWLLSGICWLGISPSPLSLFRPLHLPWQSARIRPVFGDAPYPKSLATFWPNGAIRSPFKGNRISLGAKVDQRGYCYADKQRNSSPNAKFFQQLVWRAKRKTFRFLFVDVSIKEGNWLLLLLLHARFFCSTNTPLLPPFTTFTISLSWRLL